MSTVMMRKRININTSYDVIVIGGGPAGCAAAIGSAREGKKTLLIEATGALGGMGTNGLVPAWCPFSDGEKVIYKGIAEKVLTETKEQMEHLDKSRVNWVPIDPEALKIVYDDNVVKAGADVLFYTSFCDSYVNNGKVEYIVVNNKAGLSAYSAKVYVDCTGDADLVAFSGGEVLKGDDDTHDVQMPTHCFMLGGVDNDEYIKTGLNTYNPNSPIIEIEKDKKYSLIEDTHICDELVGDSTVTFNAGHIYNMDSLDVFSISRGLMLGRKKAQEYKKALGEYIPGAFGHAYVAQTAPLMGIRESRRIKGDYTLTVDDYVNKRSFFDEIGRNCYYIDVHSSGKNEKNKNSNLMSFRYSKGESHGIPYRCLVPKALVNVLVAGRSISTDRMVQGSTRIMPACLVTGEAAGVGAAIASSSSDGNVHNIDIRLLRNILKEHGAYFN